MSDFANGVHTRANCLREGSPMHFMVARDASGRPNARGGRFDDLGPTAGNGKGRTDGLVRPLEKALPSFSEGSPWSVSPWWLIRATPARSSGASRRARHRDTRSKASARQRERPSLSVMSARVGGRADVGGKPRAFLGARAKRARPHTSPPCRCDTHGALKMVCGCDTEPQPHTSLSKSTLHMPP